MRLIDGSGTEVARDLTDRDGAYELLAPTAGTYVVEVELPVGYDLTRARQGFDQTLDSDLTTPSQPRGDVRTVRTDPFTAGDDSAQDLALDVDLGLVVVPPVVSEPSTTDTVAVTVVDTEPATTEAPPSTEPATTAAPTTTAPPTTEAPATTAPSTTAAPAPATTVAPPPTTAAPAPTTTAAA